MIVWCPQGLVKTVVCLAMAGALAGTLVAEETKGTNETNWTKVGKPNIIVILADDLGYSDIGCFGGEIETPNLDRLAAEGLRFRNFYNTSKCHTSRVAVLTGQQPFQVARPGTKGHGDRNIHFGISMGQQAKLAGYFAAAAGKWDVNPTPIQAGFDRFYGFLPGLANFWNGRSLAKDGGGFTGPCAYMLDDKMLESVPKDFYATDAITDHALEFMKEAGEKPFFLYLAYNAPHYPLQAPEEDVKKYRGSYRQGWEAVRQARVKKMHELGILPAGVEASSSDGYQLEEWDRLTEEEKDWEDSLMATYAAMVNRMDRNIGRVVEWLKAAGKYDNTLILFASDNGACPMNLSEAAVQREKQFTAWDPRSFLVYGTRWAHVSDTPFRLYKGTSFEGGIAGPGIVHWPAGLKVPPGSISDEKVHLVDCMPTLIELSGGTYPKAFGGVELNPLVGTSMVPAFLGHPLKREMPLYFRFGNGRALIDGQWKIVSNKRSPWALFNLSNDPVEQFDVASKHPETVSKLDQAWWRIARDIEKLPMWNEPNKESNRAFLDEVEFPILKQGEGEGK